MTHKKPSGNAEILTRQLAAARYVTHSLIAHKYASYVASGQMTLEDSRGAYEEAMRNYDGIVAGAVKGASSDANARATAKGADAINEMLESFNGR